jgi:hypothetical protein
VFEKATILGAIWKAARALQTTCQDLLYDRLECGSRFSVIGVKKNFPYNTEDMYRGWIRTDGVFVAIHES